MATTAWFSDIWIRSNETLPAMFAELEKWDGRKAFAPLEAVAEELYLRKGMALAKLSDDRYFVRFHQVSAF